MRIAHAGRDRSAREAAAVAQKCNNVSLETSSCSILDLHWLIDLLGPSRLLMGSDALLNLPLGLTGNRSLGLGDAALVHCRGLSAAEVPGV